MTQRVGYVLRVYIKKKDLINNRNLIYFYLIIAVKE
jgi:hypothetical protein